MTKRLNGHLSNAEIKSLKNLLLAEKERIINSQATKNIAETCKVTETDKDEVDNANNIILLSNHLRFSSRERKFLKKLNKSLEMINNSDEYGMCQECGASITYSRLKARPTSEMCISCKEENEREESRIVKRVSGVIRI